MSNAAAETPVAGLARRIIAAQGPISLAALMRLANTALQQSYYRSRQPFGARGDFVTAPEVSQMFGEMLALAFADQWQRIGQPAAVDLVELGPGRGTLMADLLRTWRRARPALYASARVTLVEASAALAQTQAETLRDHTVMLAWTRDLPPDDTARPLFLIANEFFDALPIRQFVRTGDGWRERLVNWNRSQGFHDALGPIVAAERPPAGDVWEHAAEGLDWATRIGARLAATGGLALTIDYPNRPGKTSLRGVARHRRAPPLAGLGLTDLSAGVDFAGLREAAAAAGARAAGPVAQGAYLKALGIEARAAKLAEAANLTQQRELAAALHRLTAPDAMGEDFRVLALTGIDDPTPVGIQGDGIRGRDSHPP